MEQLLYRDIPHKYFGVESGLEYTPVSTVFKKFQQYTDWQAILERKAKRLGMTPEALQAEWDRKRDKGTEAGSILHEDKELESLSSFFVEWEGEMFNPVRYVMDDKLPDTKYQTTELLPGNNYPELITSINRGGVRIGGTSDNVFITKNNYVLISDYKTDKVFEYEGFRNKTLAEPLTHIPDSNYYAYSLKCSMYMYFILQAHPELKPGSITLIHCPIERDSDGVPVLDASGKPIQIGEHFIPVDYSEMEPNVKLMLNHYAKTL